MTEIPDLIRSLGSSGTRRVEAGLAASGDEAETGTTAPFQLELLGDARVAVLPPAELPKPADVPASVPSWYTSNPEQFVLPADMSPSEDLLPEAVPSNGSALGPDHHQEPAEPLSLPAAQDGVKLRAEGENKVPAGHAIGEGPGPKPTTITAEPTVTVPRRETDAAAGTDTLFAANDKQSPEREDVVERIALSSPEPRTAQTGPTLPAAASISGKAIAPVSLTPADSALELQTGREFLSAAEGLADIRKPGADIGGGAVLSPSNTALASGPRTMDVIAQIASRLTETGSKELTIRLDPPELGSVRIVLSGSDGSLSASVIVDRAEVDQFLRRHADELESALAEAGYGSVDLEFRDNPPEQDEPPEFALSHSVESIAPAPNGAAVHTAIPASGLDIRL